MANQHRAHLHIAVDGILRGLQLDVADQEPGQGAAQQKAGRDDAGRRRQQAEAKAQLPLPASSSR